LIIEMIHLPAFKADSWKVEKIAVIGPGIVGMPMAALLADTGIRIGTHAPARVVVVQRDSPNSGWKVNAINDGRSVIGGIEPELDEITASAAEKGLLTASHDFSVLSDADVILVSVQTDKKGSEPDYGPLFAALENLAQALKRKPQGKIPLIIFESTLAPTTMDTIIRDHFKKHGMHEGMDILLGNSPNRVMPGRLVDRIRKSDKLAGGLHPDTSGLIERLYNHIVSEGKIYKTNSLSAEIVKTLENAYRDVRIAFSSEIARYCDDHDIDFYQVRDTVNFQLSQSDDASSDPNAVPAGGMLIPMLGVGGHCLPKDGVLLWWRRMGDDAAVSKSLILNARLINDDSPELTYNQAVRYFKDLDGARIALLGVAYRFNSEDTRNSPTLSLANHLRKKGIKYIMHDPYVKADDQNLLKDNQASYFTSDLDKAIDSADYIIMCTAHMDYMENAGKILTAPSLKGVFDACNLYDAEFFASSGVKYIGIGRGSKKPDEEFTKFVYESFRVMEKGLANELLSLIDFYNANFVSDEYNKVDFKTVQILAATCSTGCEIADPGPIENVPEYNGFKSALAVEALENEQDFSDFYH
jgi:UDP-N-acetyl-D-mannosaminuronic acid dehydrogenase